MSCTLCGKKAAPYKVKKGKKKLNFCRSCKDLILQSGAGKDYPIIWVGRDDLINRYEDDPVTLKLINRFGPKDFKQIADTMADWFWNSTNLSEWYSDSVCEAFEDHLKYKEEQKLRDTPRKKLPLMIGTLKYLENEKILEELLRSPK